VARSIEIRGWSAVLRAVVALAQAPVVEDGDAWIGERDLDGLEGSTEVRGEDGAEPVVRAARAEFPSLVAPGLGELPGQPACGSCRLIVLGRRVGLEHDVDRHVVSNLGWIVGPGLLSRRQVKIHRCPAES
jgi:hypothetical protein